MEEFSYGKYTARLQEQTDRSDRVLLALSDAIIELGKELGTESQPASSRSNSVRDGDLTTIHPDAGPRTSTKPNEALRPKKLNRDCTPVELNLWVESFKAY